jgi:hypothetical protein
METAEQPGDASRQQGSTRRCLLCQRRHETTKPGARERPAKTANREKLDQCKANSVNQSHLEQHFAPDREAVVRFVGLARAAERATSNERKGEREVSQRHWCQVQIGKTAFGRRCSERADRTTGLQQTQKRGSKSSQQMPHSTPAPRRNTPKRVRIESSLYRKSSRSMYTTLATRMVCVPSKGRYKRS